MSLRVLAGEIAACRRCPRLVAYLAEVGRVKKREFRDETYWARPLPGSGDPRARVVVVGLAPAAHGGCRTGRVFTGDDSSQFLARALHRVGWASQPTSTARDDGLRLRDVYITLAARCAPPRNRPTPEELRACRPYLVRELELLPRARVVIALGRIAFDASLAAAAEAGWGAPARKPAFGHGAEVELGARRLVASYHPSRQNTNTGKLTRAMFDAIFDRARAILET
ncbi:MAG TPA: uracil-DNA glycosylase [Haliangiales bacterium]|nr:uracil-DNA glycosylase [Haliangiales bacterium]